MNIPMSTGPESPITNIQVNAPQEMQEQAPVSISPFVLQDTQSSSLAPLLPPPNYLSNSKFPLLKEPKSDVSNQNDFYALSDSVMDVVLNPKISSNQNQNSGNVAAEEADSTSATTSLAAPKTGQEALASFSKQTEEFIAAYQNILNQMPDSPQKVVFADFLKIISQALQELQKMMQETTISDSKKSKEFSVEQKKAADERYEKYKEDMAKQKELQEKIDRQNKKMGWMSKLTKPMGYFGIIMNSLAIVAFMPLAIASFPMGAVVMSMMVIALIDSIGKVEGKRYELGSFKGEAPKTTINEETGLEEKESTGLFGSVGEHLGGATDALATGITRGFTFGQVDDAPGWLETGVKMYGTYCLAAAMTPLLATNPMAINEMVKETAVIEQAIKGMGGSDRDVMICEMTMMAAIMVTGIVFAIWSATSGAALLQVTKAATTTTSSAATQSTNAAIRTLQNAAKAVKQFLEMIARALSSAIKEGGSKLETFSAVMKGILKNPETWLNAFMIGSGGAALHSKIIINEATRQSIQIKADMDSYLTEQDAYIANLKKIIQILLDALAGGGALIQEVGETQRKMFQDFSKTTTPV